MMAQGRHTARLEVRARRGDYRGNRVDEAVAHGHHALDMTDLAENLVADRDGLRPEPSMRGRDLGP
jgi:hypothetical protein